LVPSDAKQHTGRKKKGGEKGERKGREWEEVDRDAKGVLFGFGIEFMSFTGRLPALQKFCSKGFPT